MFLHNAMFDSGAFHNLMPKIIMEYLGLDINRPYKDLYSFDSKEVKCLGLIKDLVVSLHQILEKNLIMDVVVANVPQSLEHYRWTYRMPQSQSLACKGDCKERID